MSDADTSGNQACVVWPRMTKALHVAAPFCSLSEPVGEAVAQGPPTNALPRVFPVRLNPSKATTPPSR